MSKNIMTSGIEIEDVVKSIGFPIPEDMVGKTFAEVMESGDVTVGALTATENKVYTAPEGKAYSPVTVNVPRSKTTVYAWAGSSSALSVLVYKDIAVAPNDLAEFKSSKVLVTDSPYDYFVTTEDTITSRGDITSYERISDTSFKISVGEDEYVYTRDSTKDFTLWEVGFSSSEAE